MITTRLRTDPEKKWHDVNPGPVNVGQNAGAFAIRLTTIGSGTSNQSRIGSEITPVYVGVRGTLVARLPSTSTNELYKVRIMVVQWNGDDILSANQPSLDASLVNQCLIQSNDPFAFRADNLTKEYKLLYDSKHIIVDNYNNPDSTQMFQVDIPAKVLKTIQYNAGASSGANNIYLLACSDSPAAGSDPVMNFSSRVRYTDL